MAKEQYIAMSRGRCPGLWTYYEFFSTLDEDNETTQGDWKQFAKKDEAVDYLYKHFVPGKFKPQKHRKQFFSALFEWKRRRRVPDEQVHRAVKGLRLGYLLQGA